MPNQIYSLNPSNISVTNSFAENVEKLKSLGIPASNIIDIYIESQKYAKDICSLTNPMRFIEARESEAEFSNIRFRQLERAYNDVVRSWSKLKPLRFIHQYEAYVAKSPNNTGIENGIVSQIFFRFTTMENNTLIVDPSPSFIAQQKKYHHQLTYTYFDDRYYEMCRYSEEKDSIKDFRHLGKQSFDRVLYFARDSTPKEIQHVLENIKSALMEQISTGIYILMPTMYLEKRHTNWTYSSLDFLGGRKGLTYEFNYQTVCLHILSGILYRATNMKTVDYANKYLFEPLGIAEHKNYYAETAEEHKAFTIGKTPKDNIWFSDPDGLGTPGYGLCMSAEEMAKIGLMCLNNGGYNGKQIISSEWITEMTRPRTVESEHFRGMEYGYLWWIIDRKKNIYAAIGNSGNVIYVNPERDIVVAVASYFKPTVFDRVDFIREHIEPLIAE